MASRWRAAGFTLVELLVVMMLLSVLMVLTSAFGSRSLDLIGQVGSKSAADRIAELVFEQIVRDIDQRVIRREPTMRIDKNDSEGDDELVLVTRRFGLPERAAVEPCPRRHGEGVDGAAASQGMVPQHQRRALRIDQQQIRPGLL